MALQATIGGNGTLFIGEDKTFNLEVLDSDPTVNPTAAPIDISGWSLTFDVRSKDTSPAPAILAKTPSIVGIFNTARNLNTQRARVAVIDEEMNLFKGAPAKYRHSWKRLDEGGETILAWGDFLPQKATAP